MNLKFSVLFILLVLTSLNVNAFTCRDYTGNEYNIGKDVDIHIPINSTIVPGESILFDLSQYFSCRNDWGGLGTATDFMYLNAPGITTVLDSSIFSTSATINGIDYGTLPIPNPASVLVYSFKDYSFRPIPIKIAYTVSSRPGKVAKINAGDEIAKISMRFYSIPAGGRYVYNWTIRAANSAVLTSGTCEINNGGDITVNFGAVPKSILESNSSSGVIRRTVEVPYRCQNPVSMPISISLSANATEFSSDLISLSNENLGVQMLYQGKPVKPGNSIKTELSQGIGQNTFEFVLLKKTGVNVSAGPFTGSAVLVMSAD